MTFYAIIHLIRPAKAKTPATSASYHFFALFTDTGLIPFYVYILLNAINNMNEASGSSGRWTSFFSSLTALDDLILVTVIGAGTQAGLHTISIGFDVYHIIIFRRIARLPPDMNPLEDNLTSRRSRSIKHQHKDSDATLSDVTTIEKNRQAHLSGSTLSVDRHSRSSIVKGAGEQVTPFMHSRMGSDTSFSPHNPDSARLSRQRFDEMSIYHDARSAHSSRQDLRAGPRSRSGSVSPTKHDSFAEIPPVPLTERSRTPRPGSFLAAPAERHTRQPSPAVPNAALTHTTVQSQQKQGLLNDNWYVLDDEVEALQDRHDQTTVFEAIKAAPMQHDRHDRFDPQPLRMNPPTPPAATEEFEEVEDDGTDLHFRQHSRYEPISAEFKRANTILSHASSEYSDSAESLKHSATPKSKYYGDLAAATRGVRGMNGLCAPTPQPSRSPSPPKKEGRVISRTGVDIADHSTVYLSEQQYAMKGRRQVSGKAAEEGRGGWEVWKR